MTRPVPCFRTAVARAAFSRPWALKPDRLAAVAAVIARWDGGVRLSPPEIAAAISSARVAHPPPGEAVSSASSQPGAAAPQPTQGIAVLNIFGLLGQRMNMMDDISGPGGTSTESVGRALDELLADGRAGAIVLRIDSPGGDVYGVQELADKVYAARARKRIVAIADSEADSGAFWIGTAASEFVVTPGGEVGSVGVWAMHVDESKANEMDGLRPTLISAGKYKTEMNPFEPLSEEARAEAQKRVDEYYRMFIAAVARNRGVSSSVVEERFGQGRSFRAAEAITRGMADRVESFDGLISRLSSEMAAANRARGMRAALAERANFQP